MNFMKRKSESDTNAQANQSLANHPAYAGAIARAAELNAELEAHRQRLAGLKLRASRAGSDARAFIAKQAMVLTAQGTELDVLARAVIAGATIMDKVSVARMGLRGLVCPSPLPESGRLGICERPRR
jgi:hypothetical protein